ncbi:MAG: rhomboid family intramembrane serine protease [Steroidobacteraceae bacterium]
MRLGAVDGASLSRGEVWRLIASQFLHVHAPHMLFNALGMLAVGSVLERRGAWVFGLIALVGGSAGQVASVIAYPELVSSGASQSLMALCGAALLLSRTRPALLLVGFILAVQIVLDVRAAQTLKAGHVAGFAAGLLLAGALLLLRPVRTETRTP